VEKNIVVKVNIDGVVREAQPDELLIDLTNRAGASVPHVCYHPQLGPVQTCDTSPRRCGLRANRGTRLVPDLIQLKTPGSRSSIVCCAPARLAPRFDANP